MTLLPDSNDLAMMSNLPDANSDTSLPDNSGAEIDFQFPDAQEPQQPPQPVQAQPAPQQPDIQQRILDTLDRMQQPQPQPQFNQPQQPAPWVDPAQRPENVQRANDLLERLGYDENARSEYNIMQAQWQQERMDNAMNERFGQFQQQQMLAMQAPAMQQQAFQHVSQQYGQALTQDAFNAVVNETFGGNPTQIAQALNPQINPNAPQLLSMLADAAYGRALRSNPNPAPQNPAPPASVNSQARNPAPSRANNDVWQNNKYVDDIIAQAFGNPFKFSKPGGNQ